MSKLLINEYPLQVLPTLAVNVGLNEALILQQLHYWLNHAKVEHDGKLWIYKSLDKWQEQDFPFWSITTIRRAVKNLSDRNLILIEKLSKDAFNRVNHYTINYEELEKLNLNSVQSTVVIEPPKMDASMSPEWAQQPSKMDASHAPKMDASLREQKDFNKDIAGAHNQGFSNSIVDARNKNAQSILDWIEPSKEVMQAMLFRAGVFFDMTDGQYYSHVQDFKAHYEQAAIDGRPITTESNRQAKLRNWLSRAAASKKNEQQPSSKPHSNRSDSFDAIPVVAPSNQPSGIDALRNLNVDGFISQLK